MKIEMFKDKNSCWRIRMKSPNGRILMSSEAYSSKTQAKDTALSIIRETNNHGFQLTQEGAEI